MDKETKLDSHDDSSPSVVNEPINMDDTTKKPKRAWLVFLIVGLVALSIGIGCLLWVFLLKPQPEIAVVDYPVIPSVRSEAETYSALTGQPLADASKLNAPVYCIQTPNGTDGARPQVGLTTAGVIFEAIAEAGITRFAAIYQDPTSAVIGPIRSLRIYYLQWDTPFDCTIVHAGGSGDALEALWAGGYRDLTENYAYMYRGTAGGRLWNNLFTTSEYLKQFNSNNGYNESNIKGFARMTPEESKKSRVDSLVTERLSITTPTAKNTAELQPRVTEIGLRFGGYYSFNVDYKYDLASNRYLRSYESGYSHDVYSCPDQDLGERNPEEVCELTQMAPDVVIAMVVSEHRASDNYHEDIAAIGAGEAYIFQNGLVQKGTWNKASTEEQIRFLDENGAEIKLAPGQTIISAVPEYGSVDF